ncbi:hypothetical protein G7B40_026305 [Aetokthonos hydrillicola Thurmond2011]|jgi:hypothetical protein|uniref:Uncharacterized protein n=1 Tax=Aetokthonos hydrillicola Thurmond2011 TaxID=2712845 RepID=A0AAP5IAQ5_9CYAN|nr:hypothetical protein [Aetokthonos hydrillicola]MBO3460329.1 hypothetical protein [Aetokthonos hydrillicola CCALA 1050]MDR9898046.1 hypothetical protein [Aetokthonos hydrillicola Thurmond2011]
MPTEGNRPAALDSPPNAVAPPADLDSPDYYAGKPRCRTGSPTLYPLTGVGFLQIHLGGVRLGRPGGEGGQGRNSKFKYMY